MIKVHYPDRINGFNKYETVARRRKAKNEAKNEAKKRSRKEKNDKNRQK